MQIERKHVLRAKRRVRVTRTVRPQQRVLANDLLKQLLEQAVLTDAAMIDEDRRVGDNDHFWNDSLRDWMSEVSICCV